jgi:acetate kinase
VLCVNAGSSSLKLARIDEDPDRPGSPGERPARVLVERIGAGAAATVTTATGAHGPQPVEAPDHATALRVGLDLLDEVAGADRTADVVAHRIVHGGPEVTDHCLLDDRIRALLARAEPFAPLHLPAELDLVDAATRHLAGVPQVACLDTAFHRHLLPESRRLPIPERWDRAGVRRYGFHGLSYEHLVSALGDDLGPRAVLAHLGNGASAAAVLDGTGVDTTMGLTPTGGLVMSTRTGDLDPGVLLHLLRTPDPGRPDLDATGLDATGLERVVDHESGLVGLCGSSDLRDVVAAAGDGDDGARLALDVLSLSIAKHVAALSVTLGGLDTLVFTAGIGEHSPDLRALVATRLAHLGVDLDPAANAAGAPVISRSGAAVTVRVVAADEEQAMAGHALRLAPRPSVPRPAG